MDFRICSLCLCCLNCFKKCFDSEQVILLCLEEKENTPLYLPPRPPKEHMASVENLECQVGK